MCNFGNFHSWQKWGPERSLTPPIKFQPPSLSRRLKNIDINTDTRFFRPSPAVDDLLIMNKVLQIQCENFFIPTCAWLSTSQWMHKNVIRENKSSTTELSAETMNQFIFLDSIQERGLKFGVWYRLSRRTLFLLTVEIPQSYIFPTQHSCPSITKGQIRRFPHIDYLRSIHQFDSFFLRQLSSLRKWS